MHQVNGGSAGGTAGVGNELMFGGGWPAVNATMGALGAVSQASNDFMMSGLSGDTTTRAVSSDQVSFTPPTTTTVSTKSSPKKRSAATSAGETPVSPSQESYAGDVDRVNKRQRNTEAARRYRQRKCDRLTEVEEALAAMTKERDDLRLQLARSEAEADVLRRVVRKDN